MMKFPAIMLLMVLAASLASAAPKVRWPRDVVEWGKLKEAEEAAQKEGKGFAFIFIPSVWDTKDSGVVRSIEATNDAIRALKSFCFMVKGNYQEVADASRGKQNGVPKALITGLSGAGNSYPLVVILDGEMKTVLGKTSGNDIYQEGSKVFREAKKMHRELQKKRSGGVEAPGRAHRSRFGFGAFCARSTVRGAPGSWAASDSALRGGNCVTNTSTWEVAAPVLL